MPTLAELRVRGTYDGSQINQGTKKSAKDVQDAGRAIKQAADQAEAGVRAANTKMGQSYAQMPLQARKAYDEAIRAQQDYQRKAIQGWNQIGVAMSVGISVPFGLFAKQSLEVGAAFEQTMDVLQVSIQGTTRDMEALRKKAVELGADINLPATSANDAARAMTQLAKGGMQAADVMAAARGTMQLAAATGIDAAEAATIQARALNAFGLEGAKATHVADLLAKANTSATGTIQDLALAMQQAGAVLHMSGQTIEDTTAALTLMAKAGIVGSDAGTSLKSMFMRLQEGGSIKKVRDLLHGYGIEIYDASGAMKDMRGIIEEFTPMMEQLTEKQRNAALAIIFGSDAVRSANIVLGGGVKAYDAMREKLDQQGAAADLAAARNKGLAGSIDGLKSAWETLMQQSADPILKPLASATRAVADLVGAFAQLSPGVRAAMLAIGALAGAAGPAIVMLATLKTAWLTLVGVRSAATAATAAAAGSEAALAAAQTAVAATAAEATAAESALATAEGASGAAAVVSAGQKATLVAANQAVAVSAGSAAAATSASGAAAATAAGSTGLLAGAMTFLASPVGLVTIAVLALTAAIVGLHKWSQAEAEQAKENEKAFRADMQATYDSAKAKVALQKETKALLAEYETLAKNTARSNEEQKRYQDVANQLSLLMPDLVKGYTNTGNAILDVAKAHKEAARQAQHHYDKEMQLAQSRLNILDYSDARQRMQNLRSQGAGFTLGQLEGAVKWDQQAMNGRGWFKYDENIISDTVGSPIADALRRKIRAQQEGDTKAYNQAQRDLLKSTAQLNDELRKTEAESNRLMRESRESRLKAELGPEGYAKRMEAEAKKQKEAEWKAEAEQRKKDLQYQKDKDAWFKAHGYTGIDELATQDKPSKKGGSSASTTKAETELTAKILEGLAKRVNTPAGVASCGYFVDAMLKATGAVIDRKGYGGGAKDILDRARKAGAFEVSASQARPGDIVYYNGPQYGAKNPKTGERSGYHVGMYEGDGFVIDSSGEGAGNVRLRHRLNPGAKFLRPVRTGKFANAGEAALHQVELFDTEQKRLEDERKQRQKEVEDAFKRTELAIDGATAAEQKYADMLGLTLDRYKELSPLEKERADKLFTTRSAGLADRELARMKATAGIDAMADPTERALAQFKQSLEGRNDLADADKARLIDQKRTELLQQRAAEHGKELLRAQQELQLIEATTEQERIRLRLMMARPELNPDELNDLAQAEYRKFVAEQGKAAKDELVAKQGQAAAAGLQLEHDRALHDIQADMTLSDQQRRQLIEDQNDALELQLFMLEQQARVVAGEITAGQRDQLVEAERLRIAQARATRDQLSDTERLRKAQEEQMQLMAEKMDQMAQAARSQAESLADILVKPFQDGLGNGMRGVWQSLVDGWRQTVRQMFLDWAKSQLVKALEPIFQGRELRQWKANEARNAQQQTYEREAILTQQAQARAAEQQAEAQRQQVEILTQQQRAVQDAASSAVQAARIAPGETGGMPDKYRQDGKFDVAGGLMAAMALMGGKRSLLGDISGILGLLIGAGAFKKGGFLGRLKFAAGGDMPYGQPALVGEFGPELWMPPESGGRILNANDTQHALASGPPSITVVQHITTPDTQGFRRSQRQIASGIWEAVGNQGRRNFSGR